MKRFISLLMAVMICLGVMAVIAPPTDVHAAEVVRSGTFGTCKWELTDDGVLTIHEGTLGIPRSYTQWPWAGGANGEKWGATEIRKVVITEHVKDGGYLHGIFNWLAFCEEMDLSGLDLSGFTGYANGMFEHMYSLKKITIGDNFKFAGSCRSSTLDGVLTQVYKGGYTGKWVREDGSDGPYDGSTFRSKVNSDPSAMSGTWVLEETSKDYEIVFIATDASGSMQPISAPAKEDFTLPANTFVNFGYDFDHWDDGNGHTYADKATIPANTYAADETVTLTAVFTKRDTSINWDGNSFEFSIKAGEEAVVDGIPAGTSYQVYELTPDGWVLVQQENSSGVIESLQESAAAFWNKYQPGVTTVQFSGLKTLDGHPAEADAYTFELVENGEVIDTVTTQDGGFIQFKVIEYDDTMLGTHNYIIREVDPNDDTIDYDTHEEQVTVEVTDNGDGTLSSEVTYDADGIAFSNTTRPGTLRITKDATNGTSQNADDTFTIEIEFRNESGMPINDDIYWYIEGGAAAPSEITDKNQE